MCTNYSTVIKSITKTYDSISKYLKDRKSDPFQKNLFSKLAELQKDDSDTYCIMLTAS